MDSSEIIKLKREGLPLVQDPNASKILESEITALYIKSGLNRSLGDDRFKEEVVCFASLLLTDIKSNRAYRNIRSCEIRYIFNEGLKGCLGRDSGINVTYRTIIQWVECYVNHAEYMEAKERWMRIAEEEKRRNQKQLTAAPEPTDEEMRGLIEQAYQSYCDYRERTDEENREYCAPRTAGQVLMSNLPIICKDFGSKMLMYLVKKGLAKESDSFPILLGDAYNEGRVRYFEEAL